VAEDRNTEPEDGQKRPSRPVTAAARRERRASARPAARKDAAVEPESPAEQTTIVKPAPKGKAGETKDRAARRSARTDGSTKAPDTKGRPTRTRDGAKVTRQGLFSRLFRFLREVVAELRKVIWPTRKQMITYTSVVLVFLAVMVALIAGLDVALARGVLALFG
jgi:preprotein translocase subunit SecE